MLRSSLRVSVPDRRAEEGVSVHDKYELMEHRLGVGHFSEVRLALERTSRHKVAIKVIRTAADASRVARVQSEIAILRSCLRLGHPNLVRLLDSFEARDGVCYMVLEFLSGGSLLDLLSANGRLPEDDGRNVVRQIASGLQAIHAQGIVHRDLKPENILFDADRIVKLVDFGFAKAYKGTPTAEEPRFASSPCGTPGFVAPEVLHRTVQPTLLRRAPRPSGHGSAVRLLRRAPRPSGHGSAVRRADSPARGKPPLCHPCAVPLRAPAGLQTCNPVTLTAPLRVAGVTAGL